MKIYNLIKITAGGHHAWYDSDLGFPIRKPFIREVLESEPEQILQPKIYIPWWRRLWNFIKSIFHGRTKQ